MARVAKKDLAVHEEVDREVREVLKRERIGVKVTGIWLRGDGNDVVVEAEIGGQWVEVIREHLATPYGEPHTVSHIVEVAGIRKATREARSE